MPAFGTTLSRADLAAVVAYVATLNGIANPTINLGPGPGAAGPAEAPLSPEARARPRAVLRRRARLRALLDVSRSEWHRDSGNHADRQHSQPMPLRFARWRRRTCETATVDGEAMPALIVSQGKTRALFYDLTSVPPVLRTVDPSTLKVAAGQHVASRIGDRRLQRCGARVDTRVPARSNQAVASRRRSSSKANSRPMPCCIRQRNPQLGEGLQQTCLLERPGIHRFEDQFVNQLLHHLLGLLRRRRNRTSPACVLQTTDPP